MLFVLAYQASPDSTTEHLPLVELLRRWKSGRILQTVWLVPDPIDPRTDTPLTVETLADLARRTLPPTGRLLVHEAAGTAGVMNPLTTSPGIDELQAHARYFR